MRIFSDKLVRFLGLCVVAGVLMAGVMFPVVGGMGVLSNQASATVDSMTSELTEEPPPGITKVTDRHGKTIAQLYNQYRVHTPPDEINERMKWALLSIEDKRFYQHNGMDMKGTMRAAISNSQGGSTQGGSTLTQQYVKNYLINVVNWDESDQTHIIGRKQAQAPSVARKLKEARIAVQLEQKMSKDEILAGYLNVVEFSRKTYGVGAAAKLFFGVEAKKLTVPQAALLAGLVNNPQVNDPWTNPGKAKAKRNEVLDKMVDNKKLALKDAKKYKKSSLGVKSKPPKKPTANCVGAGSENGFFCRYLEDYLESIGINRNELYNSGYTIKTTLDRKINSRVKKAVEGQVPKYLQRIMGTQSVVKPGTKSHEVVALAASKDYGSDPDQNQTWNPYPSGVINPGGGGSTYKIFTAAAAMKHGKAGIYTNIPAPAKYTSRIFPGQGSNNYSVSNAGDTPPSYGQLSLQHALAYSPNTSFIWLEEQVGMKRVVDMAERLGMRNTMTANTAGSDPKEFGSNDSPLYRLSQKRWFGGGKGEVGQGSFTLGVSALSGLELANVGATIMSGGKWCPPSPIKEVRDRDGKKVKLKEPKCEQAVPKGLADSLAVGMSKDTELSDGTAHEAAQNAGWDRPMIAKTGTSEDHIAATFLGATRQYSGASMVFQPDGKAEQLCDGGSPYVCGKGNMYGGKAPARMWFNAMKPVHKDLPKKGIPKADPKYMNAR